MRRISLRRPSPALVLAAVALGVALSGTGYATVLNVPRNSVGTPQLKNSAVTGRKLAPNSVTTATVRNHSLLRADFVAGQLPAGPTGPQGPAGATGPAGPAGAPGVSGLERVEVTSTSSSGSPKTAHMACPTGKRLLGGGARLQGPATSVAIQASFPDNDNTYTATAREVVATSASWSLTVFAVCAVTT